MTSGAFRGAALRCLGGAWSESDGLEPEELDRIDRGDHVAVLVSYLAEPADRVRAWLLLPKDGGSSPPRPAIAVWHQHAAEYHLGKSESAGFAGNPAQHAGLLLVRAGWVVLCPDALCFEDRRHPDLEGAAFEKHMAMRLLTAGKCLAWKNILDCRRAVDYLSGRPEADANRMGCYGHSLGSTLTWLTGAWDERLKCMVGNCCMPSQAAMDAHGLNHSFSNYIPGLGKYGDIPEYVGLVAPRRLHLNFGAHDRLNPVDFIERELPRVQEAYRRAGAEEAFTWHIDRDAAHELSPPMREAMLQVFRESL